MAKHGFPRGACLIKGAFRDLMEFCSVERLIIFKGTLGDSDVSDIWIYRSKILSSL